MESLCYGRGCALAIFLPMQAAGSWWQDGLAEGSVASAVVWAPADRSVCGKEFVGKGWYQTMVRPYPYC